MIIQIFSDDSRFVDISKDEASELINEWILQGYTIQFVRGFQVVLDDEGCLRPGFFPLIQLARQQGVIDSETFNRYVRAYNLGVRLRRERGQRPDGSLKPTPDGMPIRKTPELIAVPQVFRPFLSSMNTSPVLGYKTQVVALRTNGQLEVVYEDVLENEFNPQVTADWALHLLRSIEGDWITAHIIRVNEFSGGKLEHEL